MKTTIAIIAAALLAGCAAVSKPIHPDTRRMMFDDIVHAIPQPH